MHYHIIVNVPGYMPENDPYVVPTIRAAHDAIMSEVRSFREDGYTCTGNSRDGYHCTTGGQHDLGYSVEMYPCNESRPGDCDITGE